MTDTVALLILAGGIAGYFLSKKHPFWLLVAGFGLGAIVSTYMFVARITSVFGELGY